MSAKIPSNRSKNKSFKKKSFQALKTVTERRSGAEDE